MGHARASAVRGDPAAHPCTGAGCPRQGRDFSFAPTRTPGAYRFLPGPGGGWIGAGCPRAAFRGGDCRGRRPPASGAWYASLSFLHTAAECIGSLDVPTYIYHLGDYDPSGVNAGEKIEQTLRELAPDAEIHFERLAVTPDQIEAWRLPTRPTKQSDTRSKGFGDISVELDAIDPHQLRALVEMAINIHLPQDQLRVLKAAEESERQILQAWAQSMPSGAA